MKQTLKKAFQPLEIALKKVLGIRKVKKGHIFDLREKTTRFVLFLPLFQKIRTLTNISELATPHTGGGIAKVL